MSPTTDSPRLRALIYNRVSSAPSGSQVSVESQDRENRSFCEQQGWEVVGTITDNDRSASRHAVKAREGYEKVRRALNGTGFGRVDVVVCWESSRAQRGLGDFVPFRDLCAERGVLFAYKRRVFNLADGDDRFTTGLDALLDEREAERARDRTLRSHRDSVTRGTPRGVTPYGYSRIYDAHSGRMTAQVLNPETAPVVQEIARRILGGDTLYAIASDLNSRGVLTPLGYRDQVAGKPSERAGWSSSMIRNMMAKQSLMGVRTHRGVAVREAVWPPVIEPGDWAAVQAVLKDPVRSRSSSGVAVRHLLSGIAECGVCGAWMRPLTNRGKRGTYVCAGKVPTDGKGHVARLREPLEAMVVRAMVKEMESPKFIDRVARRGGDDAGVAAAQRELADLRAHLAQFEESAGTPGGVSAAAFARIEARLLPQIADAEERSRPRLLDPVVARLVGPGARERWDGMSLEEQRRAVRSVCRVIVHRSSLPAGTRAFDDSTIELVWR